MWAMVQWSSHSIRKHSRSELKKEEGEEEEGEEREKKYLCPVIMHMGKTPNIHPHHIKENATYDNTFFTHEILNVLNVSNF